MTNTGAVTQKCHHNAMAERPASRPVTKTVVPVPYDPSETAQVYTQHSVEIFNTKCPKIGAAQWTCTKTECVCHLKESISG